MNTVSKAEKELYFWQMSSDRSNFSVMLFNLIAKSDTNNIEKLRKSFPDEVEVMLKYQTVEGYWEELENKIKGNKCS